MEGERSRLQSLESDMPTLPEHCHPKPSTHMATNSSQEI